MEQETERAPETLKAAPRPRYSMARQGFLARVLSRQESREMAPKVPSTWYGTGPTPPGTDTPFASGIGFVSSPFSSYFEKVWGVAPLADQARYRLMYRTVPKNKTAVEKLVESAISKGFSIDVKNDDEKQQRMKEVLDKWLRDHPEMMEVLHAVGKDCLVHGYAFVEPCYPETLVDFLDGDSKELKALPDYEKLAGILDSFVTFHSVYTQGLDAGAKVPLALYSNPFVSVKNDAKSIQMLSRGREDPSDEDSKLSELVWLKPLDPLTMRVRRDSFGNIYGAVQFVTTPPVAFDTSKIVIFKFNPTSTFQESAHGVSLFQSLIRTQEAIWQIENDLLVIGHALAKPPQVFTRGRTNAEGRTVEKVAEGDWQTFVSSMAARKAGSDIFTPSWVTTTPLPSPGASIAPLIAELNYHDTQRTIGLRVPPQLLGVPEGSSRTTASVNQSDYILTVQAIQNALGRGLQEIFKLILAPHMGELGGPDFEPPLVKWNPILERDETVELDKILNGLNAGVLTLKEARQHIAERGIFEIDPEDEAALQELKDAKAQASMDPFGGGGDAGLETEDGEAMQEDVDSEDREQEPPKKVASRKRAQGPPDATPAAPVVRKREKRKPKEA